MTPKFLPTVACVGFLGTLSTSGCQHLQDVDRHIVLHGFSDVNYVELNRNIGAFVCVRGALSIDSAGVYFALQPIEDRNIIDIGFSRIISGLSYQHVRRNGMVSGRSYRVCGTLRDATPFRQCSHDHCKWYKLENAELR